MPAFWIGYRPLLKMQHQLCANHIQKLSKSLTCMGAPLPEASTLAMPYDKGIHEKHHIPMTADRLIISYLILVETKVIFSPEIELIYGIPKAPAMQDKWCILEGIIAHKHIYILHIFLMGSGFDYQHPTFTRQIDAVGEIVTM